MESGCSLNSFCFAKKESFTSIRINDIPCFLKTCLLSPWCINELIQGPLCSDWSEKEESEPRATHRDVSDCRIGGWILTRVDKESDPCGVAGGVLLDVCRCARTSRRFQCSAQFPWKCIYMKQVI